MTNTTTNRSMKFASKAVGVAVLVTLVFSTVGNVFVYAATTATTKAAPTTTTKSVTSGSSGAITKTPGTAVGTSAGSQTITKTPGTPVSGSGTTQTVKSGSGSQTITKTPGTAVGTSGSSNTQTITKTPGTPVGTPSNCCQEDTSSTTKVPNTGVYTYPGTPKTSTNDVITVPPGTPVGTPSNCCSYTYEPPVYEPPTYDPPTYTPPTYRAPTCDLNANKTTINKGESVKLIWNTSYTNSVTLHPNYGSVSADGYKNVSPEQTTTYVLTAYGKQGGSVTCVKTIIVNNPAPTCTLNVDRTSINRGENVTFSWSTTNAQTVSLSHFGTVEKNGSRSHNPQTTTTYTLTVVGENGQTVNCTKTITVHVPHNVPACTLSASHAVVTPGQAVTLTWNSTNTTGGHINLIGNVSSNGSKVVYPTYTTTYVGTFYGTNGQHVECMKTIEVNHVVNPGPTCSLYVNNNQYVTPGQAVTLTWNAQNAQYGWINNNIGSVNTYGSKTVYPTQTTTYTATFTGYNGQTVNCSVTVYIGGYVPPTTPYITLSAVPYTGLELGPVGTALYWGFLVLWALFAAYLIVVKRVQNNIYAAAKNILFGSDEQHTVAAAHAAHEDVVSRGLFSTADLEVIANTLRAVIEGPARTDAHVAHAAHASAAPANDAIDEFVLSQISRPRR